MKLTPLILISLVLFLFYGCKKKNAPSADSSAAIISFLFMASDNPGVLTTNIQGNINADSIFLSVPEGTNLHQLVPAITFAGKSITPTSGTPQDFSTVVHYLITSSNGSMHSYTVVVHILSSAKKITAFVLRSADNPGMTEDLTGVISGDTIRLTVDPGTALQHLVPTITYTGNKLSAASGVPQDFSKAVQYTVYAEDGSNRTYTVYAGADLTAYFGSADSWFYALDAASGALKWRVKTGGAVGSCPWLSGGTVYFCTDETALYALDAQTGALKWKYYGSGITQSNPTVSGGLVYFAAPGTTGGMVALDTASGQVRWKYQASTNIQEDLSPTIINGVVYFPTGFSDKGMAALDALTGAVKWSNTYPYPYYWKPAYSSGTLYLGFDELLLAAIDATSGVQKWYYKENDLPLHVVASCPPTVANGIVYVGGLNGYLYAIDAATGQPKWKQPSKGAGSYPNPASFSGPLVSGTTIYSGAADSYIYAFDASSGQPKWTYGNSIRQTNPIHVAIGNLGIYAGGVDGFHLLDAATGNPKWTYNIPSGIYSGICVVDSKGNIFRSTSSGDN